MLGVARGDSLEPRAQPPRSAAPICAFPSERHAAMDGAPARIHELGSALHKGSLRCELRYHTQQAQRLVRCALSHCCVSSIAAHRETIQVSPQSHETRNAPVLPFTALAISGVALLEAIRSLEYLFRTNARRQVVTKREFVRTTVHPRSEAESSAPNRSRRKPQLALAMSTPHP